MKNWPSLIGFLVVAILAAFLYWQFYRPQPQPPAPEPVAAAPATVRAPDRPAIQHPVTATPEEVKAAAPQVDPAQPLPALQESDQVMAELLAALFADKKLDRFFVLEHFIERFVVMVDSLPRQELPETHRPVKKTAGSFMTKGEGAELHIDPANYRRYDPLVRLLAGLDTRQVVAVYKRLYPLFQEAYERLGYPDAYFNDRLVEVIDHLVAAPMAADPVYLVRPKALYLYADPALEQLSSGRKIMLRIGPENAARMRGLLQAYRPLLASTQ